MENFKFLEPIQRGKKGLWCQRLAYKDEHGIWKQTSKSGFLKKRDITTEVKNNMLKEVSALLKISEDTKDMTLHEFIEMFLADRKNELADNTIRSYKPLQKRFKPLFKKAMKDITYTDCIKAISCLDGYSQTTIKQSITQLKTLFKFAVRYKVVSHNPIADYSYKSKTETKNKLRILNENDMERLLDYYHEQNKEVWIILCLMRYCGLRKSEALGVCWKDISNKELSVSRQYIKANDGTYKYSPLKTKNSYRTIPIPVKLQNALKEYERYRPIFNKNNRLTSLRYMVYYIKKILPTHTPHDFRHTYATKLLAEGVDIRTVASLLGDTVSTVENVYIHYSEEMRKNAAEKLNKIFG